MDPVNREQILVIMLPLEFADGSRLELQVRDQDFGLIVEGDRGELLYQGTRFKSFNRDLKKEHLNF